MIKKFFTIAILIFSIFITTGCKKTNSSSSNPTDPTSSTRTVLHGNGVPSNTIGDEYDIYVDESTMFTYQKNNNAWINTETKANTKFYSSSNNKKVTRLGTSKTYKENTKVDEAIIYTLMSTDTKVDFEMKFGENLSMYSAGDLYFDGAKTKMVGYPTETDFDNKTNGSDMYFKYDSESEKHYIYQNDSWVDAATTYFATYSLNCFNKYFESAGIDGGLAMYIVGNGYYEENGIYTSKDAIISSQLFTSLYKSYDVTTYSEIKLSEDQLYVDTIKVIINYDLVFKNQTDHYYGQSIINLKFSNINNTSVTGSMYN